MVAQPPQHLPAEAAADPSKTPVRNASAADPSKTPVRNASAAPVAKQPSARPTVVRAASTLVAARSPVAVRRGADGSIPLPVTTTLGSPPEEYDDEYEEDEMDVDDAATSVASSAGGYEDDEDPSPISPTADNPGNLAGAGGSDEQMLTAAGVARARKRPAQVAAKPAGSTVAKSPMVVAWPKFLDCFNRSIDCNVDDVAEMNAPHSNVRQHVFETAVVMLAQDCRAALEARRRQKFNVAADESAAAAAAADTVPHKQPRLGRPPKASGVGSRSLTAQETASIRLQAARDLFGFATSPILKCALYAHMTCYCKSSKQTVSRQWLLLSLLADQSDVASSVRSRFATGNDLLDMFESANAADSADQSSVALVLDTIEHDRPVDQLLELLQQRVDSLNRKLATEYMARRITSATQPSSSEAAMPSLAAVSTEPLISRLVPWMTNGLLNVSDHLANRRFSYALNYSTLAKFIDDAGYYKAIDTRIELLSDTNGPVPPGTVPPSLVPYEPFIEEYLSKAFVPGTPRSNRRASIVRTGQLELKNTLLQVREAMRSLNAIDKPNYVINPTITYEAFFTNTLETEVYVNKDGYKVEEIKECVVDVFSSPFNSDLNKLTWSERLGLLPQKKYVGITLRSLSGSEILRIGTEQKWKWCIASHYDQNRGITRYSYPLKRTFRPKLAADSPSN